MQPLLNLDEELIVRIYATVAYNDGKRWKLSGIAEFEVRVQKLTKCSFKDLVRAFKDELLCFTDQKVSYKYIRYDIADSPSTDPETIHMDSAKFSQRLK